MPSFISNEQVEGPSDRSFGMVFGVLLAAVGLAPMLHGHSVRSWAFEASVVLFGVGLVRPSLLHPANFLWTRLAKALNGVFSPIALGILFYFVVSPVGLLMRCLGQDPLRLRYDREARTYWRERTPGGAGPESMANQF